MQNPNFDPESSPSMQKKKVSSPPAPAPEPVRVIKSSSNGREGNVTPGRGRRSAVAVKSDGPSTPSPLPPHMPLQRTNSGKKILAHAINHPTKKLRMKSLLWMKPTVAKTQLTNSTYAQVSDALHEIDISAKTKEE